MDLIFAGAFLAVSSNTRYQIINGLERLVEASPVAKRVLAASLAFTVGVRFANNVYGGMQFVDAKATPLHTSHQESQLSTMITK